MGAAPATELSCGLALGLNVDSSGTVCLLFVLLTNKLTGGFDSESRTFDSESARHISNRFFAVFSIR